MNLMSIYSVPVWQSEYPNYEEEKDTFIEVVNRFRENNPESKENENVNYYQSPDNLHHQEELRPLLEYICHMVQKANSDLDLIDCDVALTGVWVNIQDNSSAILSEHVHKDTYSGVFYLKAPEGSGKLSISNIAVNKIWQGLSLVDTKNQFTAKSIKINPVDGQLLLWPSYIPHSVEPNAHDEERISISFTAICLPKGTIIPPGEAN